jgi:hypothetical protein
LRFKNLVKLFYLSDYFVYEGFCLLRWRSSTLSPHRLRRAGLQLPLRRLERGLLYFHHGLLDEVCVETLQLGPEQFPGLLRPQHKFEKGCQMVDFTKRDFRTRSSLEAVEKSQLPYPANRSSGISLSTSAPALYNQNTIHQAPPNSM